MVVIINLFTVIKQFINIKNFKLRFISTLILLVVFFAVFLMGNPVLPIFLIIIFLVVLYEFNKVCYEKINSIQLIHIIIFPIMLFVLLIYEVNNSKLSINNNNNYFLLLLISLTINFFYFINFKNIIKFIMSTLLIISFFSLIKILLIPNGLNMFLYLVVLVSVMDIFAYLGGNFFGIKKIAPKISSGKTIEGTLIGLFCTTLASFLIKELMGFNFIQALLFGLTVGVFAFLGDLFESFFKRKIGIKDSGNLIPGHGGLLDRFDGYILILPLFYISLIYLF
jgi:phosphatidate cytidylyltransferase